MDASYPGLWKTLKLAVGTALELSVSLAEVGVKPGERLSFELRVERIVDGTRRLVQRLPAHGPIAVQVPTAAFDATHWRV